MSLTEPEQRISARAHSASLESERALDSLAWSRFLAANRSYFAGKRSGRALFIRRLSGCAVTAFGTLALAACASTANFIGDPYVAPAKFQFLRCPDIGKRLVAAQSRQQELHALMERANSGTGGSTVNMFVYSPELSGVDAEVRELRRTAADKKCPNDIIKAGPDADIGPIH